ncbi:MAG: hypothetical protein KDA47_22095 [Planctomycetales bacterium]|nr:hypothetical protein [Planctomycetales bacterium]
MGGLGGFLAGIGPSLPSYAKVLFNIADDKLVVWQGIAGGVIVAGVAIAAIAAFRPEA